MLLLAEEFPVVLSRYVLKRGSYPYRCHIRSPAGRLGIECYSPHDMLTVNEVFFRLDYVVRSDVRVVVDVGANIGVSALYFLSTAPGVRCYLFEPNPANLPRLRRNLAAFEDRYVLEPAAIADRDGVARFGIESSGRYGGIGIETGRTIEVRCHEVNAALGEIVLAEGRIDVLKVDTEGSEAYIVRTIRPDLLERIDMIYLESDKPTDGLHRASFETTRRGTRERLIRRRAV